MRQWRKPIERAAILSIGSTTTAEDLESISPGALDAREVRPMNDLTRAGIERALAQSQNVPEAADRLGMSRSALYRHMKKLNITPPRQRPA